MDMARKTSTEMCDSLDTLRECVEITARGIITIGGFLLVAQGREDGFCHLPGGHVEAGEAPANALQRELQEELGRTCSALLPVAVLQNCFDKGATRIREEMWLYACTLFPVLQEIPPRSREDWLTFRWISLTDLAREKLLPPAVYPYCYLIGGH